jgi:putative nucleotidyltransferase with HDIG domain
MENERGNDIGELGLEAKMSALLEGEPKLAFLKGLREKLPKAEWFLVGGAVRDLVMGRPSKDYDLVVRHADLDDLDEMLEGMGSVNLVGKDFSVLKFQPNGQEGEAVDIAWPRTERAGGSGAYRDFSVQSDPKLPIELDLKRRDFTVNAMAWDIGGGRLIDPHGGLQDIKDKVLRAVGQPDERFGEDYSRVLRALRISVQLGFRIDGPTWEAVKRFVPRLDDERDMLEDGVPGRERILPREVISREIVKSFGADPVRALDLFESSGALFKFIPELIDLPKCEQSPDVHSEGDVWTHTKLAVSRLTSSRFAEMFPGERPSAEAALAALLHDIGKPRTAGRKEGGRSIYYGHEEVGAAAARSIADRLKLSSAGVSPDRLSWLVRHHMFPNLVDVGTVKRSTLVRYFLADPELGRTLMHLAFADGSSSIPLGGEPDLSNLERLMAAVSELKGQVGPAGKPHRLLTGQDVMEIAGLSPGPEVGRLLAALEEAHLQGKVKTAEEARQWLLKV